MNYSNIVKSNVKFFLSSIFAVIACVALNAAEVVKSSVIFENAIIVGKEYMVVESTSENKDTSQRQNIQSELKIDESQISLGDSAHIFIVDDTKIYGKEHLFVKQNTHRCVDRSGNISRVAEKEVANNDTGAIETEEEPITVAPVFPFLPSSSSYLYIGKELVASVSQQRLTKHQPVCKTYTGSIYPCIENSNSSIYLPEQRQKFSIAATQCGILTSFSLNSPPVV